MDVISARAAAIAETDLIVEPPQKASHGLRLTAAYHTRRAAGGIILALPGRLIPRFPFPDPPVPHVTADRCAVWHGHSIEAGHWAAADKQRSDDNGYDPGRLVHVE
jgi:hypothetical protein